VIFLFFFCVEIGMEYVVKLFLGRDSDFPSICPIKRGILSYIYNFYQCKF
jgi:hypothetical protein